LGQLATIGTGTTPGRKELRYWRAGQIPWVTSSAVNNPEIATTEEYVTQAAASECRLKLYPSGTLLVALYGEGKTRGKAAVLALDATINQALAAVQPSSLIPVGYLKLVFDEGYDRNRSTSSGGVQPNLNLAKVAAIPVPLPPKDELNRILSEVDSLLETSFEANANLADARIFSASLRQAILTAAFRGDLFA
jgi:type I restriction enzyme S subunit